MSPALRGGRWRAVLDGAFLLVLGAYAFGAGRTVPFHGDEPGILALSGDFTRIFRDRDLESIRFSGVIERTNRPQRERIATGALTPLTMGLVFNLAGASVDELPGYWLWGGEVPEGMDRFELNASQGNLPEGRLLHLARATSSAFFALSIALVFVIILRLTRRRPGAYLGSLIYATSPSLLINGTRALQEGALLFFSAAAVLLCLWMTERESRGARLAIPVYFAMGALSGLGLASKQTFALVLAAVLAAIFLAPWALGRSSLRAALSRGWAQGLKAGIVGFSALTVFFGVTPIWWSWIRILFFAALAGSAACLLVLTERRRSAFHWLMAAALVGGGGALLTFEREHIVRPFSAMVEVRTRLMASQAEVTGGLYGRLDRGLFLMEQAFFGAPQYYESPEWGSYDPILQQIDVYEGSIFRGIAPGIGLGLLWIAIGGLGIWEILRRGWDGPAWTILLWLAVPAAALFLANPLPWQRYYVGLQAPLAALYGAGAARIAELARGGMRPRVAQAVG
jgi:hypothetical protein